MKYIIDCPHCGEKYELSTEFKPSFCLKCGFDKPNVECGKRRESRDQIDYDAVERELAELENLVSAVKENEEREIERIKRESKEQIAEYKDRIQRLKNKLRWRKIAEQYEPKDYSNGLAVQMFGKRLRDLTPDEKREYKRESTRRSREKAKREQEEIEE